MHVPHHDFKTMDAVYKYMAANRWDELLNFGDFGDYEEVSAWNYGLPLLLERRTIEKTYGVMNDVLDEMMDAANSKAPLKKKTFIEGNHEYRISKHLEKHPELRGSIEPEIKLLFDERGIDYVQLYSKQALPYRRGHAYFIHGKYYGNNHAKKHVDHFGCNIFYGHTHDVMGVPKTTMGDHKTRMAQSFGFLGRYDMSWRKGDDPSSWQQAFGEFVFRKDGFFQYWVTLIFNNSFVGRDGNWYEPDKGLRRPKYLV